MRLALFFLMGTLLVGCHKAQPEVRTVDITLRNDSSYELDWVEMEWQGPNITGGVIPPGVGKTALGAPWRRIDNGKINFVDEKTRKPYSVEVSFSSVNEKIFSGHCDRVVIRILDYDKADVICE